MRLTHVLRAGVVVAVSAVAVLAFAGPASAHVTVNPSSATQGGYAKLAFRVPNERPDASTVSLEVNIPPDAPIASVSVKPLTGWTAAVTRGKLATPIKTDDGEITEGVQKIVWTAGPDAAIKPGEFQEFEISAGPLPEVDQIIFKSLQTYSSGEIVRWIDEPKAGVEVEHPAPTLKLAKGTGDAHADQANSPEPAHDDAADTEGGEGVGTGFGIAGAVLGLAALAVALLAYRRSAPRP
jgi:uncharacterized protein YcnI